VVAVDVIPSRVLKREKAGPSPLSVALSGHVIEWFEFGVYGVVAAYVAAAIFPADDQWVAMTLTWSAYAVAFIVRPIGGLYLARIGNRFGRTRALYTGVLVMSGATFAMGLVPGWEAAGLAAPLMFTALRALQGFAIGGEMASSVTFLTENSVAGRVVRDTSLLAAGTFAASLVGSMIATVLALTVGDDAMAEWGWRVLFVLALPLGVVAFRLRRRASASEAPPGGRVIPSREDWRVAAPAVVGVFSLALLYNGGLAVAFGGYLNHLLVLGHSRAEAMTANAATYAALVAAIVVCHRATSWLGITRAIALGTFLIPVSLLAAMAASDGSLAGAVAGGVLLAIPLGLVATPVYLLLSAAFPRAMRLPSGGLAFNAATACASTIPALTLLTRPVGLPLALGVAVVVLVTGALTALALSRRWLARPAGAGTHLGTAA
jgi:MHS family proline/betaine transporter-like MFS transporter